MVQMQVDVAERWGDNYDERRGFKYRVHERRVT